MSALKEQILAKTWFYPFRLPSGEVTRTYDEGALDAIHHTRRAMLDAAIDAAFGDRLGELGAIDLACHQGWFAAHLAQRGFGSVTAIDARAEHVEDARRVLQAMELPVSVRQSDVHEVTPEHFGTHDLVLCFGLIYHLENPVGALRVARALTRRLCLVETQVVPGLSGWVDYGSYRFVRPLKGSFGIIDETGETHGPEASTTGICLVPSIEALVWILQRVGFSRVELLPVPEDGYEQLVHRKRVMAAAYVD